MLLACLCESTVTVAGVSFQARRSCWRVMSLGCEVWWGMYVNTPLHAGVCNNSALCGTGRLQTSPSNKSCHRPVPEVYLQHTFEGCHMSQHTCGKKQVEHMRKAVPSGCAKATSVLATFRLCRHAAVCIRSVLHQSPHTHPGKGCLLCCTTPSWHQQSSCPAHCRHRKCSWLDQGLSCCSSW